MSEKGIIPYKMKLKYLIDYTACTSSTVPVTYDIGRLNCAPAHL
jgi:hypothetical protein